jgi:hypothetical protein
MGEQTEVSAPAAVVPCPVCTEPLEGRPERCFRCETALGPWWGFEEALSSTELGGRAVANAPVSVPVPKSAAAPDLTARQAFGLVAVIAALVGTFIYGTMPITRSIDSAVPAVPVTTVPPPPAPSLSPPPATQVVHYRVQRGDSLWRIAAAFTGDGRRWKDLWPERADAEAVIPAGSTLEVDLGRLADR